MSSWNEMKLFIDTTCFSPAQLDELKRGVELDLPFHLYANPNFTAAEMAEYRNFLETSAAFRADKETRYVVTEYGPEEACPGFKSRVNYEKYPNRVCYIPEDWDFEEGPGYTALDILKECDGDKDKADIVFDLCDWQHPCAVLGEWDQDDQLALIAVKEKRIQALESEISELRKSFDLSEFEQPTNKPTLSERISAAEERRTSGVQINEPVLQH